MVNQKEPKVTIKVMKGRAKAVRASVDGEPVLNVVKVTSGKHKAFVTTNPAKDTRQEVLRSGRLHTTETGALNRFKGLRRKFPQITPRVKKLL